MSNAAGRRQKFKNSLAKEDHDLNQIISTYYQKIAPLINMEKKIYIIVLIIAKIIISVVGKWKGDINRTNIFLFFFL